MQLCFHQEATPPAAGDVGLKVQLAGEGGVIKMGTCKLGVSIKARAEEPSSHVAVSLCCIQGAVLQMYLLKK